MREWIHTSIDARDHQTGTPDTIRTCDLCRRRAAVGVNTREGMDAFYANLEDYVRLLQGHGARVYLVLGVPVHHRFNPGEMVARSLTGFRIAPDVEEPVPVAKLQAVRAAVDAKLHTIGEHTGATLLDPLPDICGSGEGCLPFFGAGEPKYSDNVHLRPIFVREHLHFLDALLK